MAARTSLPIERINALAELDRIGWKWHASSTEEIALCCPVHPDTKPSVQLNVKRNLWICQAASCGAKGDIIALLAHMMKVDRQVILADLQTRYELFETKAISPETVEKFHSLVFTSTGPLLQELRDRGLTDMDIRMARLGYHDGRITIPILDEQHRCVNIRRYLPGAPGPEKMRNTKGYAGPHLYGANDQLGFDTIWIVGGEMKQIVAKRLLNPHGIGAVCVTASEGSWDHAFTERLKGKRLVVCMDVDAGGKVASRKVARHNSYTAEWIRIVRLPLDTAVYPKGDINDYVGREHATDQDLLRLQEEAEPYKLEIEDEDPDSEPTETKLVDAAKSENVGRRVSFPAIVQAMDQTPYIVPRTVAVACTKDQPNCDVCPVRPKDPDETTGKVELTVKGISAGILGMINCPSKNLREATREALKIPPCKAAVFTIRDNFDVLDVRLMPQLETQGINTDHVSQPAMIVSNRVDLNTPYKLTGRVYPHPKNQQAVLLLNDLEEAEDSLSSFSLTQAELETLDVFKTQPDLQEIHDKLMSIYEDFEANVTRIYKRRELHLILDLFWHSVLYLPFDGQIQKGWTNVIIVGDSSQGKSEASSRLIAHYGLGERVDCKNATVAGLLGGLQKMGERWFVSWGVIPIHDRRAVLLEEVKGASTEVISKLTDMRSSGIAEIPKIEKRKAHARTRLAWISNPRSNRQVARFNFGIETIREVVGSLEDVRRFDAAVVLSGQDVSPEEINQLLRNRPECAPTYTAELCHRLVMWAWTRTPAQIVFDREAEQACVEESVKLCSWFSEEMPLVDTGTMRFKLARLATALAARLFSTTSDRSQLHVQEVHVRYVSNWLYSLYSAPTFGYLDFSKASDFASKVIEPEVVRRHVLATKHPKDLVDHLLYGDEITLNDLQDWCAVDRDSAQTLLSFFVRKHALQRSKRFYVKTSDFIQLLKRMKDENLPDEGESQQKEERF